MVKGLHTKNREVVPLGKVKRQDTFLQEPQQAARSRGCSYSISGAAAGPGKRHGELPGALASQPAPLLDPRRVMLSDVGIGSP